MIKQSLGDWSGGWGGVGGVQTRLEVSGAVVKGSLERDRSLFSTATGLLTPHRPWQRCYLRPIHPPFRRNIGRLVPLQYSALRRSCHMLYLSRYILHSRSGLHLQMPLRDVFKRFRSFQLCSGSPLHRPHQLNQRRRSRRGRAIKATGNCGLWHGNRVVVRVGD
jgi:hypothetical protein